jgi:hypothetical protein
MLRRITQISASAMTEHRATNKPALASANSVFAKQLRDIAGKIVGETFRRQGFASAELVTRWAAIAGPEIAAHSEPIKIQWRRPPDGEESEPGTLVLRVEGPAAIEIQHLAGIVCERVNRYLGWRAVAHIALRQAPLRRKAGQCVPAADPLAAARVAAELRDIADEDLRQALARLGASVRRR